MGATLRGERKWQEKKEVEKRRPNRGEESREEARSKEMQVGNFNTYGSEGPGRERKERKRTSQQRSMKAINCNVQSAKQVWAALKVFLDEYDVILLQEVRLSDTELNQVIRKAAIGGYTVYSATGDTSRGRWNNTTRCSLLP